MLHGCSSAISCTSTWRSPTRTSPPRRPRLVAARPDPGDRQQGVHLLTSVGFGIGSTCASGSRSMWTPLTVPGRTVVPIRWSTGAEHSPLPSMEGDLELAPFGPGVTHLAMSGRYTPPFGHRRAGRRPCPAEPGRRGHGAGLRGAGRRAARGDELAAAPPEPRSPGLTRVADRTGPRSPQAAAVPAARSFAISRAHARIRSKSR